MSHQIRASKEVGLLKKAIIKKIISEKFYTGRSIWAGQNPLLFQEWVYNWYDVIGQKKKIERVESSWLLSLLFNHLLRRLKKVLSLS
jgi:hypothetical protein